MYKVTLDLFAMQSISAIFSPNERVRTPPPPNFEEVKNSTNELLKFVDRVGTKIMVQWRANPSNSYVPSAEVTLFDNNRMVLVCTILAFWGDPELTSKIEEGDE